jgi:hypothetical protein
MKMRCTMLSLALCAMATTAAAAPGRRGKISTDDADDAAPARPRKGAAPKARKARVRDEPAAGARKAEAEIEFGLDDAAPRHRSDTDTAVAADPDVLDEPDEVVVVKKAKPRSRRPGNVFYLVAGAAHIESRVASGGLQIDKTGLASLAMTGPVQGHVESDPSNIIAGMIGFAPAALRGYVAFETLIGVPKTTQLRATGDLANKSLAPTALGLVPTGIPPLGSQFGEVKASTPTLTAIFRLPKLGPLRFYAGGGVSVLFVTGARITNAVLTEVATPKLEVTPALGAVAQIGVDIHLFGRFSARLDIKEMWFQPNQATISNIRVHTTIPLLETVEVGSAKAELQANPIVVQAGIGASF